MLTATRAQRRQLERDNAKQPVTLTEVPRESWPPGGRQLRVLRSREFLVQVFPAYGGPFVRLSICRTSLNGDRWRDGITWDDLQKIKRECGFGAMDAVEIFPSDKDEVNVANMRHLWIMSDLLPFAWRA